MHSTSKNIFLIACFLERKCKRLMERAEMIYATGICISIILLLCRTLVRSKLLSIVFMVEPLRGIKNPSQLARDL